MTSFFTLDFTSSTLGCRGYGVSHGDSLGYGYEYEDRNPIPMATLDTRSAQRSQTSAETSAATW